MISSPFFTHRETAQLTFIFKPQGISTVVHPGLVIEIEPPSEHTHLLELFNAGEFAICTVDEPGAQGEGVTGVHGIGVSTPCAAAVAEATAGLAIDLHIPNGGIFTNGLWSRILAAGLFCAVVRFCGNTTSELAIVPMVHIMLAPSVTCMAICHSLSLKPTFNMKVWFRLTTLPV